MVLRLSERVDVQLPIAPIFYLAGAIWFFVFSGSAEGLASPRSLLVPVLLVALVHSMSIVVRSLWGLVGRRFPLQSRHFAAFAGTASLLVSVELGTDLDKRRIAETMRRGDVILSQIQAYKDITTQCPVDLGELSDTGVDIAKPALRQSQFRVSATSSGGCELMFGSVSFTTCHKRLGDRDWRCVD